MRNLCRFFWICRAPHQNFKKCKIRTRFVESTPLPPQCFICSIFNASYVTCSVLHMWPIQYFICDPFSAPYVTHPVPHMWPTQCFICDLFSTSYVTHSVSHMRSIQCFICSISVCRKLWISWHRNCRTFPQIYYWIQIFLTFSNLNALLNKSIEKSKQINLKLFKSFTVLTFF